LEQLASAYRVPILEARTLRAPEVTGVLRGLDVDILVVSCFPWRLPGELVSAAPLGGLNLHPSALPAYRGPDPLFWIYRHGRLRTGVTVHHLTTELDAGPIVEQARFDLPLGFPGDRLEHLVAGIGARLLVRAIGALSRGQVQAWAQPLQHASYFPWPQEDDLVIQPDWSAWRAVHFINGVVPLGYRPVYLHSGGQRTAIRRLLRWCRSRAEATAQQRPGTAVLPVRDGWLLVEEGVAERAR
jgi:methionyl-tRNA formyltransferase